MNRSAETRVGAWTAESPTKRLFEVDKGGKIQVKTLTAGLL